ncbi:MAG: helix-turn-helix domain-containing protein [Sedimentisphaeraceae bacterium JB056]
MTDTGKLSQKLKQLREQKELTVQQLSERSGICEEQINSLEAGELACSLTPLLKIARGLGVRLGTFLDDQLQSGPIIKKKNSTGKMIRFAGDNKPSEGSELDFLSLAAEKKDRHMEPFLIDVKPPKSDKFNLSSHEGEEFIYVLSGKIELSYGKDAHVLEAGDSIYYDSVVPHNLHSASDETAKILAVVYAPY